MKGNERDIFLARHGHLEKDPVRRYVGQTDYPLSSLGVVQAENLRDAFSGVYLGRIVCSDLQRTLRTAEIVAEGRQIPVEAQAAFREVSLGDWEGVSVEEIKTRHPGEYARRGTDIAGHRPPRGESFEDLGQRVIPAFQRIVEDGRGSVLIVAHVGVIRVLLCHVLDMPLKNVFALTQDYGAYSMLAHRGGQYRLDLYNCTGPVRFSEDRQCISKASP